MKVSYSHISEKYDLARVSHNYIIDILNSYVLSNENSIHVDLGCGTCKETYTLAQRVGKFIGVDVSEEMQLVAKQRIPNGEFIKHDLQFKIPLANNFANSISCISFYHHLTNKNYFFEESYRILASNGIFILISNSIEQLERRKYYDFFPTALEINRQRFMDITVLEKLLCEIGFNITISSPIIRPPSLYGMELLSKVETPAYDSIFGLISEDELSNGLAAMKRYFESGKKLECSRDRYFLVGHKY